MQKYNFHLVTGILGIILCAITLKFPFRHREEQGDQSELLSIRRGKA
jgi:hypothetical protein